MSIPTTNEILIPLLRNISDGEIHLLKECIIGIADYFNLSEEERNLLQPSGVQTKLEKRVSWAKLYLSKIGFVHTIEKGRFKITQQGLIYLNSGEKVLKISRKTMISKNH